MSNEMQSPSPTSATSGQPGASQGKGKPPQKNKGPQGKEQRKLRNLLIDSKFQLRYALVGSVVTLLLCGFLAIIVLWQAHSAHSVFVKQRNRATELARKKLSQTTKLVDEMRQNALKDLEKVLQTASGMIEIHLKSKEKAVREAAKIARAELKKDDEQRVARQKKANTALSAQRKQANQKLIEEMKQQDKNWLKRFEGQQRILMIVVICFGVAFLVFIVLFNIRFTHKAAGPLSKIRGYIDSIREGHLGKVGTLRKGDQLVDFHERFRAMHQSLVEQTQVDIESLEAALQAFEQSGIHGPAVETLRKRLATKRAMLRTDEPV